MNEILIGVISDRRLLEEEKQEIIVHSIAARGVQTSGDAMQNPHLEIALVSSYAPDRGS